jgi:multidrug efflux pump subunit AcrB
MRHIIQKYREFKSVDKIKDVNLNFLGNDVAVPISYVAEVKDTVQDRRTKGRITVRNGDMIQSKNSLLLRIYKQSKSNDVKISDGIQKKIRELNAEYSNTAGNPVLEIVTDNARAIRENIKDVKNTIYEGIFLAIIVVYFFLASWRSTFITALALPNSLIALLFLLYFRFSVNIISLLSLSLRSALIDDAIV